MSKTPDLFSSFGRQVTRAIALSVPVIGIGAAKAEATEQAPGSYPVQMAQFDRPLPKTDEVFRRGFEDAFKRGVRDGNEIREHIRERFQQFIEKREQRVVDAPPSRTQYLDDAVAVDLYEKGRCVADFQKPLTNACLRDIRQELTEYYENIVKPTLQQIIDDVDEYGSPSQSQEYVRAKAFLFIQYLDRAFEDYKHKESSAELYDATNHIVQYIGAIEHPDYLPGVYQKTAARKFHPEKDARVYSTITSAATCPQVIYEDKGRRNTAEQERNVERCEAVNKEIWSIQGEYRARGEAEQDQNGRPFLAPE